MADFDATAAARPAAGASTFAATLAGCATPGRPWQSLVDGATMKGLDGWASLGKGTWSLRDARYKAGPLALQSAAGTIRFRKLLIRSA